MSIFKPLTIATIAALAVGVSYHVAAADPVSMPAQSPAAPMGLCQDQTNMAAALTGLREAKASLVKAEHNKGGWRDEALKGVELAIAKTELGCAAVK